MRFFIFPLEKIYIGIEAGKVKCLISSSGSDTDGAVDDTADNSPDSGRQLKIPFDRIFRGLSPADISSFCHGIVLKQETGSCQTMVIITPPVERDIDVEEKKIRSLPGSFSGVYSSFNGVYFNEQKIVFFLDVEKLAKRNFSGQESE